VTLSAPLLREPNASGKTVLFLKEGESVTIRGEEKGWLNVELSPERGGGRGWVQNQYVRILKTAPKASPKKPFRLVWLGGYARGAKDFPNQFRGGMNALYPAWQGTEVGISAEVGFRHATVISAGPLVVHHIGWPRIGTLQTGVFGGFPVVWVSQNGTRDLLFGLKLGIDLIQPLAKTGRTKFDLDARIGPEILLFGSSRVSIPVVGTLGLSIRF
jgi:hypothetical protein